MAITADQEARTEAPWFDFELQFFAGGKWEHLDSEGIEEGQTYTTTASTTLSSDVDKTDTTLTVASTSGFTTGTLCIHPEGDNEQYEIVHYTGKTSTTFTGLTRGFTHQDHSDDWSGLHSSGATVSEWVDVTDLITGTINISQARQEQIGTWSVQLGGINYNSRILERDHAILCMWRFRPSAGVLDDWTDWTVAFIGYLSRVSGSDTDQQEKAWTGRVEGVAQYLAKSDAHAHRIGRVDLAEGKSVQTSSVLSDPWLEAYSGEYIGYPSLDGDQLVDGDITTLWCSQNTPSITRPTTHANYLQINEIYLQPHAGEPFVQWIEFYYKHPDANTPTDWKYYDIVNQATQWEKVEYDSGPSSIPKLNYVAKWNKGRELDADGTFVLICSNRTEFERRWQLLGGYILDWREKTVGSFSLSTMGGFVAAMFYGNSLEPIVWYGTVAPQKFGAVTGFTGHGPNWSGSPVPLPLDGHSMARSQPGLVTPTSADAFMDPDNMNPTPGGYSKGDEEWADVDLGALNCTLTAFLSSTETDEMEVSDTLSLLPAGQVMIDAEVIEYEERDDTNNKLLTLTRGVGATSPADHPVDSVVKPYENAVAYNSHLISSFLWRRRVVMNGNTLVIPLVWDWMVSNHESPIHPDHADWDDYYIGWTDYWTRYRCSAELSVDDVTVEHNHAIPATRARHVMLVIHEMADTGRAKINEMSVFAHTAECLTGENGETIETFEGALSAYLVKKLLIDFGIPEDRITITDEGQLIVEMTTAKGRYLQILNDLLKRTGCVLFFGLDGTVEHRFDPQYPLSYVDSVSITWDRDNARSVKLEQPERHNVSQVVLRAKSDTSEEMSFEVRYPPTPMPLGEILTIEDYIAGSVTQALLYAEMRYKQENGPMQATVIPAGPAEWARLGQRHLVDWTMDTEGTLLSGHNFEVEIVQWTINLGDPGNAKSWSTSIGLHEVYL